MKKNNDKGFVLAETLIVTAFVAGVLIFIFIEFTAISRNYEESYNYNTVENLYSLNNIKEYIISDYEAFSNIKENLNSQKSINLTDCVLFTNKDYCSKLFELEQIKNIIITNNYFDSNDLSEYDTDFYKFMKSINSSGNENYRIITSFKDGTYATLRLD